MLPANSTAGFPLISTGRSGVPPRPPAVVVHSLPYSKSVVCTRPLATYRAFRARSAHAASSRDRWRCPSTPHTPAPHAAHVREVVGLSLGGLLGGLAGIKTRR